MLIDVSMPITTGSVFRRGTPPVEIARRRFRHESEGDYESVFLSMPAHTATHIDLVFPDKTIGPERMIGRGRLIDVRGLARGSIDLEAVKGQGEPAEGGFVFFRTGWDRLAGSERYFDHPELSLEVVHWLISRKVNAVGIDALGLGRDRKHGEYDRLLLRHDVFVIENLANLGSIDAREFIVYCLPLSIANIDAIPARVIVETGPGV